MIPLLDSEHREYKITNSKRCMQPYVYCSIVITIKSHKNNLRIPLQKNG